MRWDPRKRQYVDERGRVISAREVRKEVEKYVAEEELKSEAEARKLITSLITIPGFFLYMSNRIEAWHKVTGAIAYGGQAQMDRERWERIERTIQSEREYLAGFRQDVETAPELTEEVVNRAGMYPNAAYSTYENNVKAREADAGVITGRRITEEDGSVCEGCQNAASDEYVPLADLLDIGSAECLNNCRCHIEFNYHGIEPLQIDRPIYTEASIIQ